jgi:hypothetical protein
LRLTPDHLKKDQNIHLKTFGTLIIDEASMLSKENLDWLRVHYPFMNIVLVGDFYQLPPIEGHQINERDVDLVFELDCQYRADVNFYNFLERIKNNKLSESDIEFINSRKIDEETAINQCLPQLTYTNSSKNSYIGAIGKKLRLNANLIGLLFHVDDNEKITYAPKNRWWHNNEIVKIIEKHKSFITVMRQNGNKEIINYENLDFWASADSLTCHKVQGQTINDNFVINLDSIGLCFDIEERTKLLYVALSRAKTLNQLFFIGDLPKIKKIYNRFVPDWTGDNEFLFNSLCSEITDKNSAVFQFQQSLVTNVAHSINMANIGNLSIRTLAKLCKISHVSVAKLIKKGLTKSDILLHYRPDLINEKPETISSDNPIIIERRSKQINKQHADYFIKFYKMPIEMWKSYKYAFYNNKIGEACTLHDIYYGLYKWDDEL